VIVAAPIHPADQGDTNTPIPTLEAAARNLAGIGKAPTCENPCDLVADKGYHSRGVLKGLDGDVWKSRISEPKPANGILHWQGDEAAQKAVYANRARLKSGVGSAAIRKARRDGRTQLCPCPGPWRYAPRMAARPRKSSETLSDPRRWLQSRCPDARFVRMPAHQEKPLEPTRPSCSSFKPKTRCFSPSSDRLTPKPAPCCSPSHLHQPDQRPPKSPLQHRAVKGPSHPAAWQLRNVLCDSAHADDKSAGGIRSARGQLILHCLLQNWQASPSCPATLQGIALLFVYGCSPSAVAPNNMYLDAARRQRL